METKEFIREYIKQMKCVQEKLLDFFDNESSTDEDFEELIQYFNDDLKMHENVHKLKGLLNLISKISNHHRPRQYFAKVEKIIKNYENQIKNFSNFELFTIFKNSKHILLFLFDQNVLTANQSLASIITHDKYKEWFYPEFFSKEFKEFVRTEKVENDDQESSEFERKRKIGENDSYICELIRDDSIEEFIAYVNRRNVSVSSFVPNSIYETNSYLLKNRPMLIEYAAFYGSVQVFKYLNLSKAELLPSLWLFVIHGRNPEIIHLLEEINFEKPNENYFECIVESIKCHHTEFTEYIQNNLFENKGDKNGLLFSNCLKFYNFIYLNDKFGDALQILDMFCNNEFLNNEKEFDIFSDFCKYDYFEIVDFLIKTQTLNLQSKVFFFIKFYKISKTIFHKILLFIL